LFADWVRAEPNVSLAAPQAMAIVCFRFASPGLDDADSDILNERIVEAVNASGDAYLTHTRLRGRSCVRVGIGNVLTEERHLAHAWSRVLAEARRLLAAPPSVAS
jgi:aromatic-L-amino-acid decarboxylase